MNIDDFRRAKAREQVVLTHWVKTSGDSELYHFGTKGHSGRYEWGSGDRPYQRLEKAHGGVFKRKKKDSGPSITEINKRATAMIKGKTVEEYEKGRDQESYDYFKKKRQEKNADERPMTKILQESNERIKELAREEKKAEKAKKSSDDSSKDEAVNEFNEILDQHKKTEKKEESKPKETRVYIDEPGRDERDMRTDRSSGEMSTKELAAYNARRKQVEQYEKYRRQDNPTGTDVAKELVKGAKSAHEGISALVNEKYDKQRKAAKEARVREELSQMSDDELKKRVQRLQWEKQYKDLSPEAIIEGEAETRKILSIIGTSLKVADMALPAIDAIASSVKKRR